MLRASAGSAEGERWECWGEVALLGSEDARLGVLTLTLAARRPRNLTSSWQQRDLDVHRAFFRSSFFMATLKSRG
eukprot:2378403-Pleurochrysis_carterae.AAC.1